MNKNLYFRPCRHSIYIIDPKIYEYRQTRTLMCYKCFNIPVNSMWILDLYNRSVKEYF